MIMVQVVKLQIIVVRAFRPCFEKVVILLLEKEHKDQLSVQISKKLMLLFVHKPHLFNNFCTNYFTTLNQIHCTITIINKIHKFELLFHLEQWVPAFRIIVINFVC